MRNIIINPTGIYHGLTVRLKSSAAASKQARESSALATGGQGWRHLSGFCRRGLSWEVSRRRRLSLLAYKARFLCRQMHTGHHHLYFLSGAPRKIERRDTKVNQTANLGTGNKDDARTATTRVHFLSKQNGHGPPSIRPADGPVRAGSGKRCFLRAASGFQF